MDIINRPAKLAIQDSEGRERTLQDGISSFNCLKKNQNKRMNSLLLLGLGVDQELLNTFENEYERIFYIECTQFFPALSLKKEAYFEVNKNQIAELLPLCDVFVYKQNPQLFPDFWLAVMAETEIALWKEYTLIKPAVRINKSILLASKEKNLLTRELKAAIEDLGYHCELIQKSMTTKELLYICATQEILCFLSLNCQALDNEGITQALLSRLKIPLVLWFVDNPYNILANLRLSWWKKHFLFVTDSTFIPALRSEGAENVFHLPLATHSSFNKAKKEINTQDTPLFFVGNSSFPEQKSFFSAVKLSSQEYEHTQKYSAPDFHTWREQIIHNDKLWLSSYLRKIGLLAELSTQFYRKVWLEKAADIGLSLMGDKNWENILTQKYHKLTPVDYYDIAPYYKNMPVTLALSSKLMPAALTQRHFDVWASGGFLISNQNNGLEIFSHIPSYSKKAVPYILQSPNELEASLSFYYNNPEIRFELINAWQKILQNHSYIQRIQEIIQKITVFIS